jgi:hypothetical protein
MADLRAHAQAICATPEKKIIGDLKLFEPKTMCPIIAVREREKR